MEIELAENGPRITEMNGRLGAWVDELAVRSGTADPADIAVQAAFGRPFEFPADPGGTTGERIAFQYRSSRPDTPAGYGPYARPATCAS